MTIVVRLLLTSLSIRAWRDRRPQRFPPASLNAVLAGGGKRLDAGSEGRVVECREAPVQLLKVAEAHAELRHDRGRDVQRLLAQGMAFACQVDAELPLIVRVASPGDQAGDLQALQHRRQRRTVELK